MFLIQCATFMELRLPQMGDLYEKPNFTMENFTFWKPVKCGLEMFAPNYQIWSNKSFGVCGSDVVLTLYGGEKKARENRHWKSRVVYNTTSLPRRRDNV